jgi:hypothetical protein
MSGGPPSKRAKLEENAAAATTTCCSTLDEAMRSAHLHCLQSHLTENTAASTFDGYTVWLHADTRTGSVSCTDCLKMLPQVWLQRCNSPWVWHRDLEPLIRAGCMPCVKQVFSSINSSQQQPFLKQAARIIVREDGTLVEEIYSMATAESSEKCEPYNYLGIYFVTELLNEAVFAHLVPASKQQSAAAPERQFDFVAVLITKLVAASAELTVVLKAALSAMLEVGCAAGIRWLRQQYCTAKNRADVIDSALLQLHERSKYRNVDVAPLSAAGLEAMLEAGEADRVLNVHGMWWRTKDEWLARRGPIDHHDAQCCASARVIMAAAGTGAESLLVGTSGDGLLCDAIRSNNTQQLAVLLSDTAPTSCANC